VKKYRYIAWAFGPVLMMSLLLSGCGGSGVSMTHQQAADRTDKIISEVVGVLHPRPGLKFVPGLSGDDACDNALGETSSQVTFTKSYTLQGISVSDNAAIGRQVLAYVQRSGYRVTEATGVGTEQPNINAQNSDGFQVVLETGGEGVLMLLAGSAFCVDPAPTAG
jgi:hypothetical protein